MHSLRRLMARLGIAAALVCLAAVAQAQTANDPAVIVYWSAGNLYSSDLLPLGDGTLVAAPPAALTDSGMAADPVLDPAGRVIAFRQPSPVALAALDRLTIPGLIAEYDLPMDIVLVDLLGRQSVIAEQPTTAVFDGTPASTALIRSAPVWSPDGAQLAWVEYPFGAPTSRIVIHQTSPIPDPPTIIDGVPLAGARPPRLRWGRAGLLVGAANADNTLDLLAYTRDGVSIYAGRHTPPVGRSVRLFDWVQTSSVDQIGILGDDGAWTLIAPDGTHTSAGPLLTAQADGALRITVGYLADVGWYWEAADPQQPNAAAIAYPAPPEAIALDPTGRLLASLGYPDTGGIGLWQGGAVSAVPGTGSDGLLVGAVLWGAAIWQLPG